MRVENSMASAEAFMANKKALVIDDAPAFRYKVTTLLGKSVDCAVVKNVGGFPFSEISRDESLRNIATALSGTPYAVILMDGDLKLGLGEQCDGVILSERLRKGVYGETNRNTPILNTSDSYENPHANGCEPKGLYESSIARIKSYL